LERVGRRKRMGGEDGRRSVRKRRKKEKGGRGRGRGEGMGERREDTK
jgi:hypothetical protein